MSVKFTVHSAYSYSPKSKTYFAAAYVLESGHPGLPSTQTFRSSLCTGIGDTREEAEQEAIKRATEGARFERIDERLSHGRKPHEIVAGYAFP